MRQLIDLVDGEYIPSSKIPSLCEQILQLSIDQESIDSFNGYRENRNKIAHGRAAQTILHLAKAVEANNFLRNFALKVDQHIVSNFLVIEPF
jgi:hypothetical protein